ncbi:MAG: hypothetical protein JO257_34345 [Deltaproteobacteria bacterium]|nr:hypothetical protein [Deltaproteobacteria bacterium]
MRCLLLLGLVACGAAVPPVPGRGGPAWIELTSEHVVLWTDAGEGRARTLVTEIEHLRQVVVGTAFRGAEGSMKTFVIALRDDDERSAFVPDPFSALASPPDGNLLKQPVIVLSASSNIEASDRIEAHELVHAISHAIIHKQPRWFAEGMAKYYETVEIGDGTADLGREPTNRGQPMVMHHLEPLAKVFECATLECADYAFYATVWALFTYLTNVHPDQLAHYEAVLAESGDDRRARQEAFAGVPLEQLETEMKDWLAHGSHKVLHFKVQLQEPHVQVRTLGDADVYAARAFMTYEFVGNHDLVRRDLAAARAIDPNNALAKTVADALGR